MGKGGDDRLYLTIFQCQGAWDPKGRITARTLVIFLHGHGESLSSTSTFSRSSRIPSNPNEEESQKQSERGANDNPYIGLSVVMVTLGDVPRGDGH